MAVIKAPLEEVFEARTNADLFKQWFARGNDATIHKYHGRAAHVLAPDESNAIPEVLKAAFAEPV